MISLLVGLACFALHAAVTLAWLRLPGRLSPVTRHAISALVTHATGLALAAYLVGPVAYWPAAAVNVFAVVCWLFLFSAVYKSVSLRILTKLASTAEHTLPLNTITEEYVRPEFEARIEVLLKLGCAEVAEDEYTTTHKGDETARRVVTVQRICGIERSGMYGEQAEMEAPVSTSASP
jgi:hypothetical protein